MTEKITKSLKEIPAMRWTVLVLLSLIMFFAYMFVDVLSPLKSMLETDLDWSSTTFGIFSGAEYFLNVFFLFLIFAGIILDKIGVRKAALLSGVLMVIGAAIKYYAITPAFAGSPLEVWLNSWWSAVPGTAKLASLGFMIFGCGVEMAGITVSKGIVKWFKGKELALAMGTEMAIARLGVFAIFRISPRIQESFGDVHTPVFFILILLIIGLLCAGVYFLFDKKLEQQLGSSMEEAEEPFKITDLRFLFTNKVFLIVAGLCVLYYSAIFPFQKYAPNMLENNILGLTTTEASDIFSWFPIGAGLLTPFIGAFIDKKGKGATLLMLGAILMIACHLTFAFILPATGSKFIAYAAIILLDVSFSLVPASLWPSVPKLVNNRYLGSAYAVIFWIQNIGLMTIPMVIGLALDKANAGIVEGEPLNYTVPMILFASLGVIAFFLGAWLKVEDKKKGYGLEKPNL